VNIVEHYLKGIQFDNYRPSGNVTGQPKSELTLNIDSAQTVENTYEVSLSIKTDVEVNEQKMFSVSLVYTGVCILQDVAEKDKEGILNVYCPHLIFPYARKMLADITREGGYQPMLLNGVDFAALYQANKEKQKAAGH
jgi:preprotein translocase subunit SecB